MIYQFFKGPGKPYRYYSYDDMANCTNKDDDSGDKYDEVINNKFIKFAIQYAKSHRQTKFIIEGIWLYLFFNPEDFKDYAVYIKGTSALISSIRACKRDATLDELKGFKWLKGFTSNFRYRLPYLKSVEQSINKWRNYYKKLI